MEFKFERNKSSKEQKESAVKGEEMPGAVRMSASHVLKLIRKNEKHGQKPEKESEHIIARSVDERPKPVQESRIKRLDRELRDDRGLYTPLLQLTVDVLSMGHEEGSSRLLNNWVNTLTQGNYEVMLEELDKCRSKWSKDGVNAVLEKWLESLGYFGVKRRYAEIDRITVSVENRSDFDNGFKFEDGRRCRIIQRPWFYRETMLRPGELAPDDEEPDGPAGEEPADVTPKEASEAPASVESTPREASEAPASVESTPKEAFEASASEAEDSDIMGSGLITDAGSRKVWPLSEGALRDFSVSGCCSRGIMAADEDTYVCEVIFTYCQKDMCGQCPTVYSSPRMVELDAVTGAVERAARSALVRGYRKFCVCLIGGDSFSAWERLKAFGEWLWSRQWDMDVRMGLTLCATELTREMRLWLLRFKDRVTVTFRYNGNLGQKLWESEKMLHHDLTDTVCVCVAAETLPELGRLLTEFAGCRKRICLELLDAGKWSGEQMEQYINQIARAELDFLKKYGAPLPFVSPVSCAGPEGRNLVTLDTDGSEYPCRYCSPERMVYSVVRNRAESFVETESGCEAWLERRDAWPGGARAADLGAGLCRRIDKLSEILKSRQS